MKILTIAQIREADAFTIKNEPIRSIDLMERASKACVQWLTDHFDKSFHFIVFSGMGNNGGDGLAIARLLSAKYKTEVFIIKHTDHSSPDFNENRKKLVNSVKVKISEIKKTDDLKKIKLKNDAVKNCVFIDAIFGSGLSKPISGIAAEVIEQINKHQGITIAIDIPSGLYGDENINNIQKFIIHADYTLTFQFPKFSFLLPENDSYVGNWIVLPIGLHPDYIESVKTKNYLITEELIHSVFKKRNKFSHKGNYGHALLIAGSYGKIGAAVLGSKACLHSGAGLITVRVPKCGYEILQSTSPESMVDTDNCEEWFSGFIDISKYNAIAIGPGIGNHIETQNALKLLIQNSSVPLIFDADAINILAENKTWISFIPKNSVFTPHPKEFERLVGKTNNSVERIEKQREFSIKHHCYIVLKGAHTSVSCPNGSVYFNSTGNPGMATAGSGDVLTGIILGLLAQGYSSKNASIIGVYIHGLAGDFFCKENGMTSLIASDIISYLCHAFKIFE